jgi:small conductance mechanosensitive channel
MRIAAASAPLAIDALIGIGRAGWVGVVLVLLALIGQAPAAAQAVPGVPGLSSEQATEPASAEPQSPKDELRAELEALLQRLEDPEQTRELAETVRVLLAALNAGAGVSETEVASTEEGRVGDALRRARPAAVELLARIEEDLRLRAATVREAAEQIYETTTRLPNLLAWTQARIDETAERQAFVSAAGGVITILGAGLLAMWLAARGLARARRTFIFREQDRLLSRWIMAALLVLLRIVPLLVFAIVVNVLILILQPGPVTQVWLSAGVSAIVIVRLGLMLAQTVLSPAAPEARLVPLSDEAARLLLRYFHWLLALGVYGYTLLSVLGWHGMPWVLRGALDRMLALALLISAVWMIVRRRHSVAVSIGRLGRETGASGIPWRRIGAVWHVFAVLYLIALFVIYIMEDSALFADVLITSSISLLLLIGLVMALRYVESGADRLEPSLGPEEPAEEEEAGEADASTAPPRPRSGPLLVALRLAIAAVAILTFLQVWGFDTWLLIIGDGPGERLMLILVIIGVIYLLWFVINRLIAGYIRSLDEQAATGRSSTRTRTALVLVRNAAFVTLCVIGGMVVLSELGLNIGPLLAGAGVIGIAIGFGAQHLVQDVITGLFNLIEDTFAVGDVVDLGGKAGVVEAVTIRTVRLRDVSGNVHTIPFSAIAVVTNMTKDFAFAAFDIGVAYRESVDEVMQVIKGVAEDLRRDRAYRRVILEPMEMLGVDAFADSAVIIKCRLKVRAGSQWLVGREFRRRLKNRFDELGIEIPFPHQTVYFGQDRSGAAPPVHVVVASAADREDARTPEAADRPAVPRLAD